MFEVVGGGFLLMAAWIWFKSLRGLVCGWLSRSWPTADGVIESVKVVKKFNRRRQEVWRQVIRYSYKVGGKVYRGSRIRFGIPNSLVWSSMSEPPFRKKDRVEVVHSPSIIGLSALQRGSHPFLFLAIIAGGVLAWMGLGLFNVPG